MSKGFAGLLLGLCCGCLPAAEVLRWQDSQGQWHFGGPETATQDAEPVVIAPSSRGLDMKAGTAGSASLSYENRPKGRRKAISRMAAEEPATEGRSTKSKTRNKRQPQKSKESCEQWRERLRKSRLGLRDHEGQSAYERECILNVHW